MLYIVRGVSPSPPTMCSIHLDDAMAAKVCQNAHHTQLIGKANQQIWGLLEGHDGQRPMGEFGQYAEVAPLLFSKDVLGFLMTTESQDLGLLSHPKDGAC